MLSHLFCGLVSKTWRLSIRFFRTISQSHCSPSQVEEILAKKRYLTGPTVTEADVRLFTTLIRFDTVYATHFKVKNIISTYCPQFDDRDSTRSINKFSSVCTELHQNWSESWLDIRAVCTSLRNCVYRHYMRIYNGKSSRIGVNVYKPWKPTYVADLRREKQATETPIVLSEA